MKTCTTAFGCTRFFVIVLNGQPYLVMKKGEESVKKTESSTKGKIIPVLIAMPILTLLLSLAVGKLILSEILPEAAIQWSPIVITGIVSIILSLFAAIKTKQKKLMWGIGTAFAYLVILLLSNLLFFGEGFRGFLPIAGAVIGCGVLGSLLAAGKRRKYA